MPPLSRPLVSAEGRSLGDGRECERQQDLPQTRSAPRIPCWFWTPWIWSRSCGHGKSGDGNDDLRAGNEAGKVLLPFFAWRCTYGLSNDQNCWRMGPLMRSRFLLVLS